MHRRWARDYDDLGKAVRERGGETLSSYHGGHQSRIVITDAMRLSTQELTAVRQTLLGADPSGKVWLFGSRADDARRGGDIDVYFETSQAISLRESLNLEYQLTTLCDAKVDLLVRNPGQVEQAIHTIAKRGISL